jgi:hypothetical protein
MTTFLEKWNPSRELERFRHEFDDLFERFGFESQRNAEGLASESAAPGDRIVR